ncbi:MAG: alkaline phosphatase family protein [Clostridium sp.]|nr:alkaline phosphatase family protein [Clostridium sp.]
MKIIMVIIDGAEALDYKDCTYINKADFKGYINNIPRGRTSESLSCIMNMLKVPLQYIPKGRAFLESLAKGLNIGDNDIIFRCNNVRVEDNILKGNKIEDLSINFGKTGYLYSMDSYKNLLVLHNKKNLIQKIKTYPPHEHFGESLNNILPSCEDKDTEDFLRDLIYKYSIYPWGESIKTFVPSFEEINGIKGAVVCSTEIVKGIAKSLKMYCPEIKNTTADVDTSLEEKLLWTLKLKEDYNFVLLHINGADESAHRRNKREKVDFIKKIDEIVIKEISEKIDDNTCLIVTSDHGTSSDSGAHLKGDVPYYLFNKNEEGEYWLKR